MSNVGINSNIFQLTGKYMILLNEFIVRMKLNPGQIEAKKKEEIVHFFAKIYDVETEEPQYQILASMIERGIRNDNKVPQAFIRNLIRALEENNTEKLIQEIEFVVTTLDSEHVEALAKIKGE